MPPIDTFSRSTSELSATSTFVESESNFQNAKLTTNSWKRSSSVENETNAKRLRKSCRPKFVVIAGQKLEPTVVYDTFWIWTSERMSIYEKRQLRVPQSQWTDDPFLQEGRFANPYRILDRTTTFLIRNVIERGSDIPKELLFRVLLFSTFMKIETYEVLENNFKTLKWDTYSRSKYMSFLNNTRKKGSWFTGSYQKPAPPFGHKSHLENHLALLEALMTGPLLQKMQEAKYLQNVFEYLRAQPGLGNFTAFQFLLNLTYTPIMNFGGMDFVVAGLGAESGIAKMFSKKSLKAARENVPDISVQILRHLCETQDDQFKRLGLPFSGLGPDHLRLDLADVEHTICEVDKYARVRHPELVGLHGRKEIKKRFDPSSRPFPEMAIPKAWSHPDRQKVRICPDRLCIERRWVVLKISAHRKVPRTGTEYLVHWTGYSDAEATWEPHDMLQEDAPLILKQYLTSLP